MCHGPSPLESCDNVHLFSGLSQSRIRSIRYLRTAFLPGLVRLILSQPSTLLSLCRSRASDRISACMTHRRWISLEPRELATSLTPSATVSDLGLFTGQRPHGPKDKPARLMHGLKRVALIGVCILTGDLGHALSHVLLLKGSRRVLGGLSAPNVVKSLAARSRLVTKILHCRSQHRKPAHQRDGCNVHIISIEGIDT